MKDDEITDVDHTEKVMKGKPPRKILWIAILGALMITVVTILIVSGNGSNQPEVKQQSAAEAVMEAKINAKEEAPRSTVDTAFDEQKKEAETKKITSNANSQSVKDQLEALKGASGVPNSAEPAGSVFDPTNRDPKAEQMMAKQRMEEQIRTSPIFKRGQMQQSAKASNPAEDELRMLMEARKNSQMPQLPQMPTMPGENAKKEAANSEQEFLKKHQTANLPEPTSILPRSKNKCMLKPGWLIPVVNKQGFNSDIPGEVELVVRENVYDSIEHRCLAIPMGSTIMITYNPNVAIGQERFNAAATVMYLPNGKPVPMMGTQIYDQQGAAGIEAEVNNHFVRMLGTSLVLGFVGKLTGNDTVSTSSANGGTTTNTTVLGQAISQSAQTVLDRNKNIRPTLTRGQATRFNLMVSREFWMEPYQ